MTGARVVFCGACQQRPLGVRWICRPCFLTLRADLPELVDAHRRLGDAMVLLPPSWRTSAIRSVRSVEAPIPFDPELALQRERITNTLAYWARMVLEGAQPRRWPPVDVTVEALTMWLTAQLGWITRNSAAVEFTTQIRALTVRSDQLAPREFESRKLPLPCSQCSELSLTQRGAVVACVRGGCRHVMPLSAYHRYEDEIDAKIARARATSRAA